MRLETPAELAQRAAMAADWGHCLDCGATINPMIGEILCKPCDASAAACEAAIADRREDLARRIIAECDQLGPFHVSNAERLARRDDLALIDRLAA